VGGQKHGKKEGRKGHLNSNKNCPAGHLRLKPIILATQETEIRRIMVGSQPGQIVRKTR
jgi:hypothetical protein